MSENATVKRDETTAANFCLGTRNAHFGFAEENTSVTSLYPLIHKTKSFTVFFMSHVSLNTRHFKNLSSLRLFNKQKLFDMLKEYNLEIPMDKV